jgi:hypothetical protein
MVVSWAAESGLMESGVRQWGSIGAHRQLEDALDQRTAEFIALQKAAVEHAVVSPIKSLPLQSALGPWAAGNLRKPTIVATEAPDGQDLIPALPQVRHTLGESLDSIVSHIRAFLHHPWRPECSLVYHFCVESGVVLLHSLCSCFYLKV